jgi:hypothetical protein
MITLHDLVAYSLLLPVVIAFFYARINPEKTRWKKILLGACIIYIAEFGITLIWMLVALIGG